MSVKQCEGEGCLGNSLRQGHGYCVAGPFLFPSHGGNDNLNESEIPWVGIYGIEYTPC